jgi:glycosyltransferase involved in cell wall biosynthesis
MRILFIGPYRQDDGWGHASRAFLKSLTLTKHDITSAPVYLNQQKEYRSFDDDFILKSESNRFEDYDVIIQNCLPHMFRKYGGVKNIGLSFFESTIDNTPWPFSIDLMDRMWVSSSFEKQILGDKENVDIVPVPAETETIDNYKNIIDRNEDDFIFYFIGEHITRKNLIALIRAFHLEFQPFEQARLVLKVNNVGKSDEETFNQINQLVNNVKSELGLHKDTRMYKPEYLITRFLSESEMISLHKQCDCFVMPSSGEGFCMPAFDAIVHNSFVIANKNCSIKDYVKKNVNGSLVDSRKCPAIALDRPISFLYNGRDYWYDINVEDLRNEMRSIYEFKRNPIHKETFEEMNKKNREQILPYYTFERVAKTMNKALKNL